MIQEIVAIGVAAGVRFAGGTPGSRNPRQQPEGNPRPRTEIPDVVGCIRSKLRAHRAVHELVTIPVDRPAVPAPGPQRTRRTVNHVAGDALIVQNGRQSMRNGQVVGAHHGAIGHGVIAVVLIVEVTEAVIRPKRGFG